MRVDPGEERVWPGAGAGARSHDAGYRVQPAAGATLAISIL